MICYLPRSIMEPGGNVFGSAHVPSICHLFAVRLPYKIQFWAKDGQLLRGISLCVCNLGMFADYCTDAVNQLLMESTRCWVVGESFAHLILILHSRKFLFFTSPHQKQRWAIPTPESEPEPEPAPNFTNLEPESEPESESECQSGIRIGVGAGTIRNRPSLIKSTLCDNIRL